MLTPSPQVALRDQTVNGRSMSRWNPYVRIEPLGNHFGRIRYTIRCTIQKVPNKRLESQYEYDNKTHHNPCVGGSNPSSKN